MIHLFSYFPTELLEKQANERIEYLKDVLKNFRKNLEGTINGTLR